MTKANEQSMRQSDEKVVDRARRAPGGATALDPAKAALGSRSRRHSATSLQMIGLAIATRLIGEGRLQATRSNRFVASRAQRDPSITDQEDAA